MTSTGYASIVFAPWSVACRTAPSSSSCATPCRRCAGRTTKQVTAHNRSGSEVSFGAAVVGEWSKRENSAFGATWHQPTGSSSAYATTPGGTSASSIWVANCRRLAAAVAVDQSRPRRWKNWHQHRDGSPRVPMTAATSSQRFGVAGRTRHVVISASSRTETTLAPLLGERGQWIVVGTELSWRRPRSRPSSTGSRSCAVRRRRRWRS
jgi:hypothetical protein